VNALSGPVPGRVASAADDADRLVLEHVAAGDHGEIEILYDRYGAMAFALAYRITGDAALAEDVVQDAFIGAWRNAARYEQGRGSVKTWLLSIVHHRAIDATRRRRPTTELPEPEAGPTPEPLTMPDLWAEVAGRLDRQTVVSALEMLSDVQREALELGYFGGLTQQEIAERTGAPLGTVKSRMRLGLLSMRRTLTGDQSVLLEGTEPG
jgi:RNA polymerase sigma-70 factor (ECF subfamily)